MEKSFSLKNEHGDSIAEGPSDNPSDYAKYIFSATLGVECYDIDKTDDYRGEVVAYLSEGRWRGRIDAVHDKDVRTYYDGTYDHRSDYCALFFFEYQPFICTISEARR